MLELNFNLYDHNFCESTIYSTSQHPEYLNAISSLFITFVGLNALTKQPLKILYSMVYSSLAINGILSYFYHYYNSIGWGLLDRMSMVLLALNTTYIFVNTIKKLQLFKNEYLHHLIIISYYSILLTVAGLHIENLFNILFALFLSSIIFFMFVINRNAKHIVNMNILRLGWKGVIYIILSGIFWIGTESLCNTLPFIKYLFGHVWWHIFVSYGGYLVSLVPLYIDMMECIDDGIINIYTDKFGFPYLSYNNIV
jgi:hypothetical protein